MCHPIVQQTHLYHAALRGNLTKTLGVEWTPVRRGVAEIRGIPKELLRTFSTRREQIETALEVSGRTDPVAAQRACLQTRPRKRHEPEQSLRERWAETARQLGIDPATLVEAVLQRSSTPKLDIQAMLRELLGPRGLTRSRTTVSRRDVMQAICDVLPPGAHVRLAVLDELCSVLLSDDRIASVGRDDNGEPRYTTAELIRTEDRAFEVAHALRTRSTGIATSSTAVKGLSAEQQDLARQLVTADSGLAVVLGPAGSGKTAALRAAYRDWHRAGIPVRGAAVAAIAARGLQVASGIPSMTLTRLLADIERVDATTGRQAGLASGSVLVLDEAAMVDTRTLTRVLEHVHAAGARLVLVGDSKQLPEIEAGGLFTALGTHSSTLRLTSNVRQTNDWERRALLDLRNGHAARALVAYIDANRVHIAGSAPHARAALADDYVNVARTCAPHHVLALGVTRRETGLLNAAIRSRMQDYGLLRGPALTVDGDATHRSFNVGDVLVVTRNHYDLGLLNGTRGWVTGIDHTRQSLALTDISGATYIVDRHVLRSGDIEYGYALTVHKAQGITVDTTLVSGLATLSKEAAYVALSRGASGNHLYATTEELTSRIDPTSPKAESRALVAALDGLQRQLELARSHQSATELLRWLDVPAAHGQSRGLGR